MYSYAVTVGLLSIAINVFLHTTYTLNFIFAKQPYKHQKVAKIPHCVGHTQKQWNRFDAIWWNPFGRPPNFCDTRCRPTLIYFKYLSKQLRFEKVITIKAICDPKSDRNISEPTLCVYYIGAWLYHWSTCGDLLAYVRTRVPCVYVSAWLNYNCQFLCSVCFAYMYQGHRQAWAWGAPKCCLSLSKLYQDH